MPTSTACWWALRGESTGSVLSCSFFADEPALLFAAVATGDALLFITTLVLRGAALLFADAYFVSGAVLLFAAEAVWLLFVILFAGPSMSRLNFDTTCSATSKSSLGICLRWSSEAPCKLFYPGCCNFGPRLNGQLLGHFDQRWRRRLRGRSRFRPRRRFTIRRGRGRRGQGHARLDFCLWGRSHDMLRFRGRAHTCRRTFDMMSSLLGRTRNRRRPQRRFHRQAAVQRVD